MLVNQLILDLEEMTDERENFTNHVNSANDSKKGQSQESNLRPSYY